VPDHRDVGQLDRRRQQGDAAPSGALQPMPRPRGCQMTSTSVPTKIAITLRAELPVHRNSTL
jgi:hypothetical protein